MVCICNIHRLDNLINCKVDNKLEMSALDTIEKLDKHFKSPKPNKDQRNVNNYQYDML